MTSNRNRPFDYNVGDTITYRNIGGELVTGVVEMMSADIKNGRPGFDLVCDDGSLAWGYDEQIVRVRRAG